MKKCVTVMSVVMSVMVLGSLAMGSTTTWYATDKIQDGDFSTNPLASGWVATGSYHYPSLGNPDLGVTLYKPDGLLHQDVTGLMSGVEYKVTADTDFWGEVARASDVHVWLRVYDSLGTLLNSAVRNGGNGWITLENVFTAPADGIVRVQLTGQNYSWETQAYWDNVVVYSSVPEPASLCVLGLGGLALLRRKK